MLQVQMHVLQQPEIEKKIATLSFIAGFLIEFNVHVTILLDS